MIIPFNIKYRPQIESGEYKVRTASGKPARVVCWDYKSQFDEPIYVLITTSEGYEYGCPYNADGRYVGNNENYLIIEDGQEIPNDLEEAAEKFARIYDQGTCDGIAQDCFIAGAKWQKEQMMKEAVEYEVGMHGEPIKITFDKYVQRARGIFPGENVRIIIVKEDER